MTPLAIEPAIFRLVELEANNEQKNTDTVIKLVCADRLS